MNETIRASAPARDRTSLEPPLIAAAKRGDTTAVERLLRHGAPTDVQDARGWTPLHYAAAGGHAETAACLLAYGARHTLADREGRTALAPPIVTLEALHVIRQRYHRFRRSDAQTPAASPAAAEWARQLAHHGIVKVSGLIQPDELGRLRSDFERFVASLAQKNARGEGYKQHYFEEEHGWPTERAFITNNAFKYSPELIRWCCKPELLEAARLYLGKQPFVQRGQAMRYLPSQGVQNDMFGWHHDLEEQRFKVMILLRDVGPDDQCMSYVLGSHTLFHPYRMFLKNACDLDYCRRHLPRIEIYDTVGNAGDVFLFDSNGAHRGVRRAAGGVRDTYFIEYNGSTSNVWGGDVDRTVLEGLALAHDPFERMSRVAKKWEQPVPQTEPSWIINLPNVGAWL